MKEHLHIVHKNGKLIIKGEMTTEHINDTIRQLQALRMTIAKRERRQRERQVRKDRDDLTFWQKYRRMNARAHEDLRRMVQDAVMCAEGQP